jgi:hypothetical protein
VAECPTLLIKKGADPLPVEKNLCLKLPRREEKGEGMGIGLVEKFDASRRGQPLKALQDIRPPPLDLVKDRAGERKGNTEFPLMLIEHLEQKGIYGKVALLGDPVKYPAVFRRVLVVVDVTHVEEGVSSETAGLVDLKIEADARHVCRFPNFEIFENHDPSARWTFFDPAPPRFAAKTKLALRTQTVVFAGAPLRGQGARGQI